MAKVLSCPDCGHKHRLDLLAGLDFFMCQNCNKKLAVPAEASNLLEDKKVLAIVATSTLSEKQTPVATNNLVTPINAQTVNTNLPMDDEIIEASVEPAHSLEVDAVTAIPEHKHKHLHVPHGHIAHIGFSVFVRSAIWIFAIGSGFLTVVIIPRLLGVGFHAIDFVDVITQTGIMKYKIVIYLVTLWALATTCFVGVFSYLYTKFKRSK